MVKNFAKPDSLYHQNRLRQNAVVKHFIKLLLMKELDAIIITFQLSLISLKTVVTPCLTAMISAIMDRAISSGPLAPKFNPTGA